MNRPDEPLDETVLDELLSADLDGELAAAAGDLGLTIEAARAAISGPAAVARRGALARARDFAGTPVPLDPDRADRLVTTAITRGRQDNELSSARYRRERRAERANRVMVVVGSAAAAIAVIFGLSQVSLSSSSNDQAASSAPTTDSSATEGFTPTSGVAFGDVTNADELGRRVEAKLNVLSESKALAGGYATVAPPEPGSAQPQTSGEFATDGSSRQYRSANCVRAQRFARRTAVPVLSGRGTARGLPVDVFVFPQGAGHEVVVVNRRCGVVSRTLLP